MSSKDMNSKEIIQEYIQSSFKKWNVMEDENIDPKVAELVKLPNGETVIFSYANIAITGTERKKPQIRVFLHEFKHVLNYAKEKNYRFFLFTIFSKSQSMAKGLNAFDPHEYIVSLETNLDNETSRRDLRSLYDFVQTYVGNGGMSKFIRCPKESHNAGINQASFIYIGNKNNREKKFFEDYITYFDNRPYMQSAGSPAFNYNTTEFEDAYDLPVQIIYYGVPGCGKSHQVNKKTKFIPDYNKIRTVFHPEYTNADFIGQILPEVCVDTNGHSVVEYKFNPGPFTEIVRRAYLNPDENFYLVIEEINRGNAAAIFGEMFQLLDRLDADEKADEVSSEHVYGKGWSSYGVDNPDINAYIRNQLVISSERPEHCSKVYGSGEDADPRLYKSVDIESENVTVTWREKNENGFTPKSRHIHFSANTAIRLPPNLSIYATMNTSDQNVFTLDNAFQRRWDMELVPNTCKWDDEDHKKQAQSKVGDTEICWETFRKAINSEISDGDFFNADDKQLGLFFIEAEGDKIDGKKFANKVLKYLWADVFKRNTDKIFKSENLSKMVDDFTGADAFDKVFVEDFVKSLNDANDAIKNHE